MSTPPGPGTQGIQPTSEQQSVYQFGSQELLNRRATAGQPTRYREWDFFNNLKGPASFIRLRANNTCVLFYWTPGDNRWNEFFEGLIANRTLIIRNEDWLKMRIQGPVNTTVTMYASRRVKSDVFL